MSLVCAIALLALSIVTLYFAALARVRQKELDRLRPDRDDTHQDTVLKIAQTFSKIGSWEFDPQTNSILWSAEALQVNGFTADAPPTYEEYINAIHPDDRASFQAALRHTIETGEPYYHQRRMRSPDGIERHVISRGLAQKDDRGRILRVVGIATDVSEQKRLETQLQQSESKMLAAQRLAELGYWEFDLQTGKTTWSPEHFRLCGYDPEAGEPTYDELVSRLHPDSIVPFNEAVDRLTKTGKPYQIDVGFYSPGGDLRWIESRGEAVRDEKGNIIKIFGACIDISDRKHLESQLRRATNNLEATVARRTAELERANEFLRDEIRRRIAAEQNLRSRLTQSAIVARLGQRALTNGSLDNLFDLAAKLLAEGLEVEYTKVLELLPEGDRLLLRAGVGWREGLVGQATVETGPNSQAGYTLQEDKPVIVTDLPTELRFQGPPLLSEHRVRSGLSTVIGNQQAPFGVLGAHTQQERQFSEDDTHFLQAIANILAAAIKRDRDRRALEIREAEFRHIFDSNMLGICFWEGERIVEANQALFEILGADRADLPINLADRTPPEYLPRVAQAEVEAIETGTCHPFEKELIRNDGDRVAVLVGRSRFEKHQERGISFVLDIRDRIAAQTLLAEQNRILEAIARDAPLNDILEAIALTLESQIDGSLCEIVLLNEAKTALIWGAAPNLPAALRAAIPETGIPIGPNVGSCGTAAYRNEPVIVSDIATDPLWKEYKDLALDNGLRACWSMPVCDSKHNPIGAFAAYYRTTRAPETGELEIIDRFAALTAIAIETKQDKLALSESEERFRRAITDAPIPIIIHAEDGEMVLVNRTWQQLTGYYDLKTIVEWTTKAYGECGHAVQTEIERLYDLDGRVDEGEYTIRTANGEELVWDFSSAPIGRLADGRRLAISMAKDVTDRHRLETHLRRSEARTRRLFESDMMGIGVWDATGSIPEANDMLLRLLGYNREDMEAGRINWENLTPPEYRQLDDRALKEVRDRGVNGPYEKEFLRQDGSRIPVLIGACTFETDRDRGFFFAIDLSERKRLERSLEQSVGRLENLHRIDRAILEARHPGTIARTALDGLGKLIPYQRATIATFNLQTRTARALTLGDGENKKQFHPVDFSEWQQLADWLQDETDHRCAYLSQVDVFAPQVRIARYQGLDGFCAFPLRAGDDLLGVLVLWVEDIAALSSEQLDVAREVSDQVAIAIAQIRLYQQVRRANSELEERVAERTAKLKEINEELKSFTYTVSHDLRAPLRALQGFSTALLEDYGDRLDDMGCEYATRLVDSAKRLDGLIQDLLAYSRLTRADLRLQPVEVEAALGEALKQLSAEIEERDARISVDSPLGEILGSRSVLTQVLGNLISNAIKFVPGDRTPQVRIWSEPHGDRLRIWVEDNGIGINPNYQERIFLVFERLHGHENYAGTGIGLAIARKGIERMGGAIGVESSLGQGSRFWIEGVKVEG